MARMPLATFGSMEKRALFKVNHFWISFLGNEKSNIPMELMIFFDSLWRDIDFGLTLTNS
ncbi:hypothetical protein B0D95_16010 [Cellvibrio sp. PSBB023]|nr:hypothetical protein B0D95_16010 [Cellvibrio sp. PSBB023]